MRKCICFCTIPGTHEKWCPAAAHYRDHYEDKDKATHEKIQAQAAAIERWTGRLNYIRDHEETPIWVKNYIYLCFKEEKTHW